MAAYNPYTAPAGAGAAQNAPGVVVPGAYVPLTSRMVFAATSVFATVLLASAVEIAQVAFRDRLVKATHVRPGDIPNVAPLLVFMLAWLLALAARVTSWVTVCLWTYRAAANLRGLGRYGMANTPGWCVGWYFVPFANIVKPVQAMSEIWRASDPESGESAWISSRSTPLLALWWGTYLLGGVISWGSVLMRGHPSVAGSLGIVAWMFTALAALSLVGIMRGIGRRQEQAAARTAIVPAAASLDRSAGRQI
jgi:hypothetical protein